MTNPATLRNHPSPERQAAYRQILTAVVAENLLFDDYANRFIDSAYNLVEVPAHSYAELILAGLIEKPPPFYGGVLVVSATDAGRAFLAEMTA